MRGPQLELETTKRPSKNELERSAGNKAVVSIRLSTRTLAALDKIVDRRNRSAAWRRFKRTQVIEEAIDQLIQREGDDA